MAIWQFTFYIVPRSEVEAKYQGVPASVDEEFINEISGWKDLSTSSIENTLSSAFGPSRKLSYGSTIFGKDDLSCIYLSFEGKVLELVTVRLDLRNTVTNQITQTIELCNQLNGVFITPEGKTIQSRREDLIDAIKGSRALKFVEDPQKFFDSMKEK